MKKWWTSLICMLTLSAGAWAAAATGMPALDDLLADVKANGPLSKRLGFTEDQRKNIQELIEKESEDLVKLRDEKVSAEKKVERKVEKKGDTAEARDDKVEAATALNAARDNSFRKLQPLMSDKQYEELKKWRAEGKENKPWEKSDKKDWKPTKD